MSTRTLRHLPPTESAVAVEAEPAARGKRSVAARRLAKLKATDMPWLTQDGFAILSDAPEISGPPVYKKPRGWR
jgi:hypothetical protein